MYYIYKDIIYLQVKKKKLFQVVNKKEITELHLL